MVVQATGSVRMNLSIYHMLGAAYLANQVAELEKAHAGESFGPFYETVFTNATGSIMLCVASLEAYVNELFVDWQANLPGHAESAVALIWESVGRQSVLTKFDAFVRLRDGSPLVSGERPTQDVQSLIQLRNALTHFRPEWDTESGAHQKLSDSLAGRFQPSPFAGAGDAIFPRGWATTDCLRWAVTSAVDFVALVEDSVSLPHRFEKFHDRFRIE